METRRVQSRHRPQQRAGRGPDAWPAKGQRETQWLDPAEAAALVNEGGLAEIVRFASHQPQRLTRKVDPRLPRALWLPG